MRGPINAIATVRTSEPDLTAERLQPLVRRNTILLAGALMLLWGVSQLMPTLGGVISVQLTGSRSMAGLASTVSLVAGAFGVFRAGWLMDRFGRRPVLIGGFLITAIGAVGVGATIILGSAAGFILVIALVGIGTAVSQLARVAAADMYPLLRRGKAVSYIMVGGTVGAVFGPIGTAWLVSHGQSWGINTLAEPWLLAPLLLLGGAGLVFLVRPDPREIAVWLGRLFPEPNLSHDSVAVRPLREILAQYPARTAIVTLSGLQATMVLVLAVMPVAIVDAGHSLAVAATLVGIHNLGMYAPAIPVGWLADRVGRRLLLITGCAASCVGCLLLNFGDDLWMMGLSFVLIGIGWSFAYLTATTMLADVTRPRERGQLVGTMDLCVAFVAALATLLGGLLYGTAGVLALGLFGTLLAAVPLVLAIPLREKSPGVYDI